MTQRQDLEYDDEILWLDFQIWKYFYIKSRIRLNLLYLALVFNLKIIIDVSKVS